MSNPILIGEGYATVATAHEATKYPSVVAFNAGNLKPVAKATKKLYPDRKIIILADDDRQTKGNPGITKATEAAKSIGGYVAKPQFTDVSTNPTDFNDLHCIEGLEVVKQQINDAINGEPESVEETPEENNNSIITEDKPYQGTVEGVQLLSDIEVLISKHVILPQGALTATALWIVATYVYDDFRIFPRLAVISPEKRCGKSTLLDILSGLCHRALIASNITPAAIFRTIDLYHPTLILDEADTFLSGRNDEIIGIINSGHTKSLAKIIRLVGDDHSPKSFSTWTPMAFASIKGIAGTIMDRSVVINLRRRMISEKVTRLPVDFKNDHNMIREKLVKWGHDHSNQLKSNPIEPPEIPNDRAMDNWLPLFTIANVLGGEWPDKVESSYSLLNSMEEEQSPAIMLLQDIRTIIEEWPDGKISSSHLVDELVKLDERPWCEWKKGSPMTQNSLAKILKTFKISSRSVRLHSGVKRGFELSQFEDAFARYIPDTLSQGATGNSVVAPDNPLKAKQDRACNIVALDLFRPTRKRRKDSTISTTRKVRRRR